MLLNNAFLPLADTFFFLLSSLWCYYAFYFYYFASYNKYNIID